MKKVDKFKGSVIVLNSGDHFWTWMLRTTFFMKLYVGQNFKDFTCYWYAQQNEGVDR